MKFFLLLFLQSLITLFYSVKMEDSSVRLWESLDSITKCKLSVCGSSAGTVFSLNHRNIYFHIYRPLFTKADKYFMFEFPCIIS
jgi:hypothetical protein